MTDLSYSLTGDSERANSIIVSMQAVAEDTMVRHAEYSVQALTNTVWGATTLGFSHEARLYERGPASENSTTSAVCVAICSGESSASVCTASSPFRRSGHPRANVCQLRVAHAYNMP